MKLWKNLIVAVLVGIAGYLSLCSIIALSVIKTDTISSEASTAKLNEKLLAIRTSKSEYDALFPKAFVYPDPLKELEDQIAKYKEQSLQIPAKLVLAADINALFANLTTDVATLRDNLFNYQDKLIERAVFTFDVSNIDRKGGREKTKQFLDMINWFLNAIEISKESLGLCRNEVSNLYERIAEQSGEIGAKKIDQSLGEIRGQLSSLIWNARRRCSSSPPIPLLPTRQSFGTQIGVFGFSGWVIESESESLVLIVGLLGFGLLGAVASSSIRNFDTLKMHGLLLPNIAPVVIRGASAAILVFLAAYGGLAVFAKNGGDPNPYVVLFACLVASVYSEDTWLWAANRFRSQLGGRGPNADKPAVPDQQLASKS